MQSSKAKTPDHRHPRLAMEGTGLYLSAKVLSEKTGLSLEESVAVGVDALNTTDSGEHRDVVIRAMRKAGRGKVTVRGLGNAYDSAEGMDLPANAKGLVGFLEGVDGQSICDAVARFESCHHIRLLYLAANRCAPRYDRTPEELLCGGWVGLRNGLAGYDPLKGTVSTFVSYRIRGSMQEVIRSESPVSKRLVTFVRAVEDAEEQLTQALSRVPTRKELEEVLGEHAKLMHLYPRLAPQMSLDSLGTFRTGVERDAAAIAEENTSQETVADAMGVLTEEEAAAVELVVVEGMSPRKAARELGVAPKQVSQRVDVALGKLAADEGMRQLAAA